MKIELVMVLLCVGLVGASGLTTLGGAFGDAIDHGTTSATPSAQPRQGRGMAVSRQAGALSTVSELGKLNPFLNPGLNPVGALIGRRLGLLPAHDLQVVHRWLPGPGSAEYAGFVQEARKLLDPTSHGVVTLRTAEFVPRGLARELHTGVGIPNGARGTTYAPGVFVESYAEWITKLTNDAFGTELGALRTPFGGLTATAVQRSRVGQVLNGAAHMDTGPSVVSIFPIEGPPTYFETLAHFRARGGRPGAPAVDDMTPVSRPGDITLHRATGFSRGPAVYHRSPFATEFNGANERTVAIASVATEAQLPAARAQLQEMIVESLRPRN